MIKRYSKKDIKVLILTLPVSKEYSKRIDQSQLLETVQLTDSTAKSNPNCFYLNMLDNELFTSRDFYDADHLNELGARKLSYMINDRIKKLK